MAGPGQRSVAFLFSDKGRHLPPPQSHCPSQMRDSLGRTARPRRMLKVHVFYFSTEDKNPSLRASLGWDQGAINLEKVGAGDRDRTGDVRLGKLHRAVTLGPLTGSKPYKIRNRQEQQTNYHENNRIRHKIREDHQPKPGHQRNNTFLFLPVHEVAKSN